MNRTIRLWIVFGMLGGLLWCMIPGVRAYKFAEGDEPYQKLFKQGNFKDALEGFRKLALDPKSSGSQAADHLKMAMQCLRNLGRTHEIDELRDQAIMVHKNQWQFQRAVAQSFLQEEHYGFIVAGKFQRGGHRGGGRQVSSYARDRARAMQLMDDCLKHIAKAPDKAESANFHLEFADLILRGSSGQEAWRLQILTDFSQIPDYDEAPFWHGYHGVTPAPVDAEGKPVFHKLPDSYERAQSDGERWRWLLAKAVKIEPGLWGQSKLRFASFLHQQFGVQTLAGYFPGYMEGNDAETGTYALGTLSEEETIARIASGIRRLKLPDEFNYLKLWKEITSKGKSPEAEQCLENICTEYENRRQYEQAEQAWKTFIKEYGPGIGDYRKKRLAQIIGNWGRFESTPGLHPNEKAVVQLRYRNASEVELEAYEVNVENLLNDVMSYLKSSPRQLDWRNLNIADIGQRLVWDNEKKYIGKKAASWNQKLNPRPRHQDNRADIEMPALPAGAYYLTAKLPKGNTSRMVVWLHDLAILQKHLDGQIFYFLANAETGKPESEARVQFFGYKQEQVKPNTNQFRVITTGFEKKTDVDGQILLDAKTAPQEMQWLVMATGRNNSKAYLGFQHHWYPNYQNQYYQTAKAFAITDRPVYRPGQKVEFKIWAAQARYDLEGASPYAGRDIAVVIRNPKGQKLLQKTLRADALGAVQGTFEIPKDATLGRYFVGTENNNPPGGVQFRVEEYKKPEFEVKIKAPDKPVMLGEKIPVTLEARYYFGAPVAKGQAKIKVTRQAKSTDWYPLGMWDWFYGRGYWWFSPDYTWYPGWANWGCSKPSPWWYPRVDGPPEIVLEQDSPVGPDGTVKFEIDTGLAKQFHGNQDHQYSITAEVVDESRRTINGSGNVLVARKPYRVFAWLNHGHYQTGEVVEASFQSQTPDGKPVAGRGQASLYRIQYGKDGKPSEQVVEKAPLQVDEQGRASWKFKPQTPGQYRVALEVSDDKGHKEEGAYLFIVRGQNFDGKSLRFNDLELIPDRREYAPGEKALLSINTNQDDGTVLLFLKPANGVCKAPKVIRLQGKNTVEEMVLAQGDMPNTFVEAVTIARGRVHTEMREVVVPPQKRILNVSVEPDQADYKPGQKGKIRVKVSDLDGKPVAGSVVLTAYDRSVEYISGGSNVPNIKEYFWKWRRNHHPSQVTSLDKFGHNLLRQNETGMENLGIFGESSIEEFAESGGMQGRSGGVGNNRQMLRDRGMAMPGAPGAGFGGGGGGGGMNGAMGMAMTKSAVAMDALEKAADKDAAGVPDGADPMAVEPTVRKNFADTALWVASLEVGPDGSAVTEISMPENLTGWKIKAWSMAAGTRVGEGEAEVTTRKDLLVRLQAPRFFMQNDEMLISANVHNYLKDSKNVEVALELDGNVLKALSPLKVKVPVKANDETRVDWRVKVIQEGQAVVRVKAITDTESDAMEMRFPSYVHGMLKTDSFSGAIRPNQESGLVKFRVPEERRIQDSRLEIRYSPSLAGAMVDALPYMVDYPYGCTEQTLNRFVPTIITLGILDRMKIDLEKVRDKRSNLNAQEIGDDKARAKGWKRFPGNPVFDRAEVRKMASAGVKALADMQISDGGWGWFSGFGEQSWPHTTAVVVHGLQIAREHDIALPAQMLERGIAWLKAYQEKQIELISRAEKKESPSKPHADDLDALVYMILLDADISSNTMLEYLYRDRVKLSAYGKAVFGIALHKQKQDEKLAMILQNLGQFLVRDQENQSAYLQLPEGNAWWSWHGSDTEANAWYLKLLSRTDPKGEVAPALAKYLLNNRKHATYWKSTRDTSYCIEALAEFFKASGEDKPDMTVEILLDGRKLREIKITPEDLFTYENQLVVLGDALESGEHKLEIRKKGSGPLYFNAYLTVFTLENPIKKAGLEVKVQRKYYLLKKSATEVKAPDVKGQVVNQKGEKWERTEIPDLGKVTSGDLVEIELEIDSKNDYEYIQIQDPKAAGFEPVELRSGYGNNDMRAYMELRDEKVDFFVRQLARGKHSLRYRMRAEIPGEFHALPTKIMGMYAPELVGNADEIRVLVDDKATAR